ncbi:hypothetical protein CVS47_02659 [Microbacterium lemovicicum]|uniref:Uncharacterized protein n=1 Tax=Microbacterium lemovicicum TaxID=1072463 RepID=A0A3Q9IZY5_9MICO|nr:hypothetical protein [Microbacterium lemovicicum]AZS38009.1 hypothetical protein CVS47_02659 [Microbacterium lemovicicum]
MDEPRTGFPRGRIGWIAGTVALIGLGVLVGAVLGSIFLGLFIAAIISIGWLIAYESWRGRTAGLDDPHDDGAQL